jgi:hypothetical protein
MYKELTARILLLMGLRLLVAAVAVMLGPILAPMALVVGQVAALDKTQVLLLSPEALALQAETPVETVRATAVKALYPITEAVVAVRAVLAVRARVPVVRQMVAPAVRVHQT